MSQNVCTYFLEKSITLTSKKRRRNNTKRTIRRSRKKEEEKVKKQTGENRWGIPWCVSVCVSVCLLLIRVQWVLLLNICIYLYIPILRLYILFSVFVSWYWETTNECVCVDVGVGKDKLNSFLLNTRQDKTIER